MKEHTDRDTVNGVDVRKLKETIQAIGATPSLADFRFRIANKWRGGGFNQSTVKASSGAGQGFREREGKFTLQVRVAGDLSAEKKREVVRLGCEFSPVYNMVSKAVPITVELSN